MDGPCWTWILPALLSLRIVDSEGSFKRQTFTKVEESGDIVFHVSSPEAFAGESRTTDKDILISELP